MKHADPLFHSSVFDTASNHSMLLLHIIHLTQVCHQVFKAHLHTGSTVVMEMIIPPTLDCYTKSSQFSTCVWKSPMSLDLNPK